MIIILHCKICIVDVYLLKKMDIVVACYYKTNYNVHKDEKSLGGNLMMDYDNRINSNIKFNDKIH